MNLELASYHHRNIVHSFSCIFVFSQLAGLSPGKENSAIVTAIAFALFAWHAIHIFMLGKHLEKNKVIWAFAGITSPCLFISTALVMVSANKIFKTNSWKVGFFGGAVRQEKKLTE